MVAQAWLRIHGYKKRSGDGDDGFVIAPIHQDGALHVVLTTKVLDYRIFYRILRIIQQTMPADTNCVELDCSNVSEFCGPWGVHFAMVLNFSKEHDLKVVLLGLEGQPLALAQVFSSSKWLAHVIRGC